MSALDFRKVPDAPQAPTNNLWPCLFDPDATLNSALWTSEGASVGFAKVLLLDLAHCVAGDVAGHEHAFGLLVFREITRDSGLDLLFVNCGSGLRSHNRHDGLAEIGVRYANHGAFSDARHGL